MRTVSDPRDSDDFVQSLSRGLRVIRAFDGEHPTLTLSDVAKRAEISPAAARRFLRTLETLGYVRNEDREFSLTPRVLELGFSYLSALSMPEIMQPHLEKLSHALGESVSAAVLDGTDIVYVARVLTHRIMSVRISIGTRFPAYATSMGRVLLSGVSEPDLTRILGESGIQPLTPRTLTNVREITAEVRAVSEQGWALVDGELELGLRSVAVPIRDLTGAIVAAINVSTSATTHTVEDIRRRIVPALQSTATEIETSLKLMESSNETRGTAGNTDRLNI